MLAQLRGGGGGGFNKINAEPALTKVGVKVKVELGNIALRFGVLSYHMFFILIMN